MKKNEFDFYDFLEDLDVEELLEFIENYSKNNTYVIKGDKKELI